MWCGKGYPSLLPRRESLLLMVEKGKTYANVGERLGELVTDVGNSKVGVRFCL